MLVAVVLGFYTWTTVTSGYSLDTHSYPWEDRYNALADGFSRGQLDIAHKPPAALGRLADPYDPKVSELFRGGGTPEKPNLYPLHDLVYKDGKLYPAFGPLPALLVFWPWHAAGLGWFPDPLAALLFGALGFLAAMALLLWLVRRFAPETPGWARWLGVLALAACTVVPYMLRRPLPYDTAQTCGYLFLMLFLLGLAAGALGDRVRRGRLTLAACALGLLAAARPNLLIAGLLVPVVWAWLGRSGRSVGRRARVLDAAALGLPVLACVVAVAVYNHARFGSFTEFGANYTLTSVRHEEVGKAGNIVPGVFFYLAAPLHFDDQFPFFHAEKVSDDIYPGHLRETYSILERTSGVLPSQPLLLWLLALPLLLRRPARAGPLLAVGLASLVALAALILVFTAQLIPGVTQRYELDFLVLLVPAALLCWMVTMGRQGDPLRRLLAGALGVASIAFGVLVGVMTSFSGSDDRLLNKHPETFKALSDAMSWFAPVGRRFGWTTTRDELLTLALLAAAVAVPAFVVERVTPRIRRRRSTRQLALSLLAWGAGLLALGLAAPALGLISADRSPTQVVALLVGLALCAGGASLWCRLRSSGVRRAPG